MKKKLSILIALVMAISLCLAPAVTQAADPGTPVIDGIASSTEWQEATVIQVTGDMGTVKVIAYPDYLYVLFIVRDSTDARLGENTKGNDKIGFNINPTDGGEWGKPYDIVFQTGADPAAFTTVPPGGVSSGLSDDWETEWVVDGVQLDLPDDLVTKTIYDYNAGVRISEWKVPLATINPSPGTTLLVGGACDNLHVVGGDQGSGYSFPPTLDWADPSGTFVDILVNGNTVVGLAAEVEDIIAITVTPTSIDFGSITPGTAVVGTTISVENIGQVTVSVHADLDQAGPVFQYLYLNGIDKTSGAWTSGDLGMTNMVPTSNVNCSTVLDVPATYSAQGSETATLIFLATATTP